MKASEVADYYGEDSTDWTKLDPELQIFYESEMTGTGWPGLRHPLVYQIPFMSWKLANEALKRKGEMMEKAIKEGKWSLVLYLYERPYRMSMLMRFWQQRSISIEQLRELLPEVWIDTEMPVQYGYRELIRFFRRAGFMTDIPGLQGPIECEVYRGCTAKHKKGISWTLDRKRAVRFAKRFASKERIPRLYRAIAPPEAILGIFNERGEQEVVVDPKLLKGFIELDCV